MEVEFAVGDYFKYVGPDGRWQPGRRGGWFPRAYTSSPSDPSSQLIRAEDFFIDFTQTFRIEELVSGERFETARVVVMDLDSHQHRDVWLNIRKLDSQWGGVWVAKVEPPVRGG